MTKAGSSHSGSGDSPRAGAVPTRPIANRSRVGFIGAGRVGCALAWHCRRLGYPIAGITDLKPRQARAAYGLLKQRYERLSPRAVAAASDVLFLTVPDSHIGPVFESVRKALDVLGTVPVRGQSPRIVVHCSGAFGPEVFAGAQEQGLGTLALHPVQSFSSHAQAIRSLPGSFFAADGSASGLRFGRQLVKQLHGSCVIVPGRDRALYHAMCVFASNFVSVLFDAAERIAGELGIEPERAARMLVPLAMTVLDNVAEQGAGPSLTGPVERGDALTVAAHLATLKQRAPKLVPLYRMMSGRLVEMARRQGMDKAALRKLKQVLKEG
ncbi:MAG: DUF2520 domain-containing protein [candidate division WOR-3 bacterium]|nr:DUF2520 domain-containing protein [candidate division WOR-3 bacterium]